MIYTLHTFNAHTLLLCYIYFVNSSEYNNNIMLFSLYIMWKYYKNLNQKYLIIIAA